MARLNVNPTRMELTRLKGRLKTARRGHKLLKDKRDELIRQFMDIARQNRDLRLTVESRLQKAHVSFAIASALMSHQMMEQSLIYPKQRITLDVTRKVIMSVETPVYSFETGGNKTTDFYPYSFATTSGELDDAISELVGTFEDMMKLAETEKRVKLLTREIEKTRRRVNALEYIMIPQFEETIRYITMKLDENERGTLTRLMKVKDMMLEQAHGKNGQ